MAGVDVGGGGGGGRRAVDTTINMVPFIDLLLVTIAFLLITAVWVSFSRLNANAEIPGPPDPLKPVTPVTLEKVLHVHVGETDFGLAWKQGATVVSETRVRKPSVAGDVLRYDELGSVVGAQWKEHSGHQDPSDKAIDLAVLHTDNNLPFKEVVAVMDAIYGTQRDVKLGTEVKRLPAFNLTMSAR